MENDLISRSELVDEIEGYLLMCGSGSVGAVHDVLDAIREAKAVDAEPVRIGQWFEPYPYDIWDTYQCTLCGLNVSNPTNYCPHCGAKMDAEVGHETFHTEPS